MVYDPVRDIDVPSPAASTHTADAPWKNSLTPGSGYFDVVRQASSSSPSNSVSGVGARHDDRPPAFNSAFNAGYSPTAPSVPHMRQSASGGLRGLLNEGAEDSSRRSSGHTVSSVDGEGEYRRSSMPRGSHDAGSGGSGAGGAMDIGIMTGMTKSTSFSSLASGSPANRSPAMSATGQQQLDHSGFLTPATTSCRTSRSPHPINTSVSPGQHYATLPTHETPVQGAEYEVHPQAGPSRHRMSHTGPASATRPMLPPDTIPRQDYYDPSRITPGSQILSLPVRSPSFSVSPRSQHQALPSFAGSRPGSATSSGQPFSFQPPPAPHHLESPTVSYRQLSEDHSRPSSVTRPQQTSRRTSSVVRRSSGASSHAYLRAPEPQRIPYQPNRISHPTSLLHPITPDEIARLRSAGMTNNPLRRKRRKPAPSWSGSTPGPGSASGAGRPGSGNTPVESDSSYFPTPQSGRGESASAGHAVDTPGAPHTPAQEVPRQRGQGKRKQSNVVDDAGRGQIRGTASAEENGHNDRRRRGNDGHYVGNDAVASHYNSRPDVGVQSREFSPIIGLKKFNNWIKSVLIGKFTYRGPHGERARVLDIGCGKGGDLNKWKQARIQLYVALDIADQSVEQARDRYVSMRPQPFEAHFFAHDCFAQAISTILPEPLKKRDLYDNVTMQFCMHYAFENASKARMMIENVSRYLRPGGVFIGTIPNAETLLARLADESGLRFGNSCYFIEFAERHHKGLYGHAYRFFLQDAVDDVPEYIVDWDNFVSLAAEYGLRVIYKKAFHEVLQEEQDSRDFGGLLSRMGVVNQAGESAMDADQWEAANLYMAFAFEKQ